MHLLEQSKYPFPPDSFEDTIVATNTLNASLLISISSKQCPRFASYLITMASRLELEVLACFSDQSANELLLLPSVILVNYQGGWVSTGWDHWPYLDHSLCLYFTQRMLTWSAGVESDCTKDSDSFYLIDYNFQLQLNLF